LVIIDEADRLKVSALEQVRDIFDKGGIGVVFIGMPGIEKRLSRYPQLYSRIGFVHAFRPLSAAQVRKLLQQKWLPSGVELPEDGMADEEALAAIIRVTGGNFRLLHRLITQIARLMEINARQTVTCEVMEAAREGLVIGTA
jgi:DNA transposition AAA+ family ATPase